MTRMKSLYLLFDTFLAGIWGLTMIDLMTVVNVNSYDVIDDGIKTLLAAAGLFYLIFVKIPNDIVNNNISRRIKKEELEKLEMENENYKESHKKTLDAKNS